MTPANCKALLEAGILQAYAEGKTIQHSSASNERWSDLSHTHFSSHASCYRIKPEPAFKVGDLVRTTHNRIGKVCQLFPSLEDCLVAYLNDPSRPQNWLCYNLTPVREVRTPFTFEQAVKAVAEHGMIIMKGCEKVKIIGLDHDSAEIEGGYVYYDIGTTCTFLDGTPFCYVTYEDVV